MRSIHSALYIHDKFIYYKKSVHWLSVWEFQNLWLCHALSQHGHACLEWRPMEKLMTLFVYISYKFTFAWVFHFFKVARYSFSRSIPPKFERKLRRLKRRFGKIDTTVVLDKEENWLWSGLQWHRSCHSNEMTPLPILLAAVFLDTGNCSSKIVYWSIYLR